MITLKERSHTNESQKMHSMPFLTNRRERSMPIYKLDKGFGESEIMHINFDSI